MDLNPRYTLEEPGGDTVDLWVAQGGNTRNSNKVDETQIPYQAPEDTLLITMEQEESIELSGILPFRYIANNESGFSNDYQTAGGEWVNTVKSFAGAQGAGLTFTDNVMNRSVSCFITSYTFTYDLPDIRKVTWTLGLEVGSGIGPFIDRSPDPVAPTTSATLDGVTLPYPDQVKEDFQVETETTTVPFPDSPEDNILSERSATHKFEIQGSVKHSNKKTFDSDIRNRMGTNQTYTYASAFPGTDYQTMIDDYNTQDDAGGQFTYQLDLIRGDSY